MEEIDSAVNALDSSTYSSEHLFNRYMMNNIMSEKKLFTLVADVIYSFEETIKYEYELLNSMYENGYFRDSFTTTTPNAFIQRVYRAIGIINYMIVVAKSIENKYVQRLPYNPKMKHALIAYEMHTVQRYLVEARDNSVESIHKIQRLIRNILLN